MNPAWIHALVLVCVFGAVVLGAEAALRWAGRNVEEGRAIQGRLKTIGRPTSRAEQMEFLRRAATRIPEGLPPIVHQFATRLDRMLMQAQTRMETPRFLLILLIAPMAIFFGLLVLMSSWWGIGISLGRIVISATFACLLGAVLPLLLLNWKANRTRKRMEDQFPVALDVFVRGLRAGHPIAAALDLLTVEMTPPIGPEFGEVVNEVTYGSDLRDALQSMAERWDLEDMRMFVVSLSVQSETGGNLAEILENLAKVIRERHAMMMKVRALSSEGRMTGVILTVLPIFTFVLLFTMNPEFFLDVANDPWFIPGFSFLIAWYLVGYFWIRKLINLKV